MFDRNHFCHLGLNNMMSSSNNIALSFLIFRMLVQATLNIWNYVFKDWSMCWYIKIHYPQCNINVYIDTLKNDIITVYYYYWNEWLPFLTFLVKSCLLITQTDPCLRRGHHVDRRLLPLYHRWTAGPRNRLGETVSAVVVVTSTLHRQPGLLLPRSGLTAKWQ